jgi:hypothetical protein
LAAPKGKSTSAHQNGYVTQSNQGSGVRAFASVPRSADDPAVTGGGSIGYNQNLRLNQWWRWLTVCHTRWTVPR